MPASINDFIAGLDPTAYTVITGAQLDQLVAGGTPYSDKGLCVLTTDTGSTPDVPNASVTTKWKRYIWLRQSAGSLIPYVWNDNAASVAVLLKWQTIAQASIGVGTIVNNMIADFTIQDAKIVSLDYSKLSGAPAGLPPSGAATGDLTGVYPNPSIAASAVTTAKINDLAVTTGKINDLGVTLGKLAAVSGSAKDMARVNAGATAMEAFTPPTILTSGVVVTTANALKIPQVATAGAGDTGTWQMVASTTLGRVLQELTTLDNTADTTALTCAMTAAPTTSNCKLPAALVQAITPISATSTLLIEIGMVLCNSGGGDALTCALFQDSTAAALAAVPGLNENSGRLMVLVLKYSVASGSTTARTYKAGFSGNAANTRYNSTDGITKLYGGTLGTNSWITVKEYI